ncbi:MAG: cbb3-type cytochrome c oxidase subunit I [Candidatus Thalassarchaeaceae archaeon]|jgi:cytochrome c oxidase subunit 1|nr:cbb3-type cytochrome c oxidase subunit I [Candidatus Thalassarchaeaceae archaeon]
MMKVNKKIIAITTLLIASLLLAPSLQAYPVGVANVDSGCTCHSGTASNDVSPFMTLGNGSALPSEYVAGETYTLSFGFTGGPGAEDNPTRVNTGGFNLVASNGELTTLDDATKLMAGQLTHTESGNDQMNWTVEWTAPSSGSASFQLTVNSVNGDGTFGDEDHWAQSTFTMNAVGGSGEVATSSADGITVLFSAILLVALMLFISVIYVFYRMSPDSFSWSAFVPWIADWLTSTDHKKIGTLYFVAGLFYFVVGGVIALLIRIQLAVPGNDFLTPDQYNQFFTLHGTVMIFLAAMPLLNGFANWIVPLQIGAKDLAFPRVNAMAFWLNPAGSILVLCGVFSGTGADVGWTAYQPLTSWVSAHPGTTFWLGGQIMLVASSTLAGINFITTICTMRTPSMNWMQMPLFTWSILVSMMCLFISIPAFGVGLIEAFLDRTVATAFFNTSAGGDPLLWSHLFWYFGHPEVYVVIIPAFGIVSEVLATSARRSIFGYKSMVYAMAGIGFVSFIVYGHHMLTSGMAPWLRFVMMLTTMAVAVPTGIKIFNWLKTMHGGSLVYRTHTLWSLGFLVTFTLGGISGMFFPSIAMDTHLHETYFVVAHFHYVLVGGTVFGIFAAIYYWYPKMTGKMMNEKLGMLHFLIAFISYNGLFWPMHRLGLLGMTRRHHTYFIQANEYSDVVGTLPAEVASWNTFITINAFIFGLSTLIMVTNMIITLVKGKKAPADPWGGWSFEWLVTSPPPTPSFDELPTLIDVNETSDSKKENWLTRLMVPNDSNEEVVN